MIYKTLGKFQSKSNPEITYTVVKMGQLITCSCPAFEYHNDCYHIKKCNVNTFYDSLVEAKRKFENRKRINFQEIINQQWEYLNQRKIARHF